MRRVFLFILVFAVVICAYAQSGTNGYYWAYIDKYKELAMEDAVKEGLAAGEPKSTLAKRLSKAFSAPRAQVYDQVVAAAQALANDEP